MSQANSIRLLLCKCAKDAKLATDLTDLLEMLNLGPYKFILASASPRRLQILHENLGIGNVQVIASTFAEDLDKSALAPLEYVRRTSRIKGEHVLEKVDKSNNLLVLSADTIVVCNNEVFEKPMTIERQREMFAAYARHPQIEVITAMTLFKVDSNGVKLYNDSETTILNFDTESSDASVEAYLSNQEGLQVAGGFKVQSIGVLFFKSIEGDYYNAVGLPVHKTAKLLQRSLS